MKGKSKDLLVAAPAFNSNNYQEMCKWLASRDNDLKAILDTHGYPPMWTRDNSFESLVHIILEQQVSLASALAALNKLKERIGSVTPEAVLKLSDEEMRACFVSRQKIGYIRGLAAAIENKQIDLPALGMKPDEEIRKILISLKGIGNWTVDVYQMFVLQRADVFPIGDLAAVNAVKRLKQLNASTTREDVLAISETWKPFRTVATMMLWHYYLCISRKTIALV